MSVSCKCILAWDCLQNQFPACIHYSLFPFFHWSPNPHGLTSDHCLHESSHTKVLITKGRMLASFHSLVDSVGTTIRKRQVGKNRENFIFFFFPQLSWIRSFPKISLLEYIVEKSDMGKDEIAKIPSYLGNSNSICTFWFFLIKERQNIQASVEYLDLAHGSIKEQRRGWVLCSKSKSESWRRRPCVLVTIIPEVSVNFEHQAPQWYSYLSLLELSPPIAKPTWLWFSSAFYLLSYLTVFYCLWKIISVIFTYTK